MFRIFSLSFLITIQGFACLWLDGTTIDEEPQRLKYFLLENRVDELWPPQDSMSFRGEPALKDWEVEYIHQ